jgi:hypothetical protein
MSKENQTIKIEVGDSYMITKGTIVNIHEDTEGYAYGEYITQTRTYRVGAFTINSVCWFSWF